MIFRGPSRWRRGGKLVWFWTGKKMRKEKRVEGEKLWNEEGSKKKYVKAQIFEFICFEKKKLLLLEFVFFFFLQY